MARWSLMSSRPEYGGGERAGAMWGMVAGRDVATAALGVDGALGDGEKGMIRKPEIIGVVGKQISGKRSRGEVNIKGGGYSQFRGQTWR
jgi:hypothetical protein